MTAILSFIKPLTIAASNIVSSNAVSHSTTEPAWSAATAYTKGTVVYRSTFNRRYQCLVTGTDAGLPEDTPVRWYDLGETDSLSMFDGEASTQSIADGTLTVVVNPGGHNALFLAGIDGTSLTITHKDATGGTVIYTVTDPLEGSEPADYYEYFFDPFKPQTDFLLTGLATYALCEVTISITNPGGIARCGMCAFGDLTELGRTLNGGSVEPKTYARIITDTHGTTSIRRGKNAMDMNLSALVDISEFDDVTNLLASVMGVPCVYIATNTATFQTMRVFGLGNGKLVNNTSHAVLTHTVQGMI